MTKSISLCSIWHGIALVHVKPHSPRGGLAWWRYWRAEGWGQPRPPRGTFAMLGLVPFHVMIAWGLRDWAARPPPTRLKPQHPEAIKCHADCKLAMPGAATPCPFCPPPTQILYSPVVGPFIPRTVQDKHYPAALRWAGMYVCVLYTSGVSLAELKNKNTSSINKLTL